MSRATYNFEIIDNSGKTVRRCSQRCDNIYAQKRAADLLASTPNAAAVFGIETRGRYVHSAYRS